MIRATERRVAQGLIALLALASTLTSLKHEFTYDDRGVIFDNPAVHLLEHIPRLFLETYWPPRYGGDGYRPMVMTLFTMQWVAGDGAPWVFHLVNILLAVFVSLAVFYCARAVLPEIPAAIAAALFAVHPLHVEVTGNVVGQSELEVAFFLTLAVGLYVRRRLIGVLPIRDACVIAALFALALWSKEHAIVLPALLLAAEWTVIESGSWTERIRSMRLLLLLLTLVAALYLLVRGNVSRDLAGFVPFPMFRFLRMSAVDRIGTMMNEMPTIAQLLVFPVHLSGDYSPNDVLVAKGFALSEIPGIFIAAGCLLLAVAFRRRAPVSSFGLLWVMISFLPVSNLLIPAGFVIAERTLFFPSIGVVLIAGDVAMRLRETASVRELRMASAALVVLLIVGAARSIDRQKVWKSNDAFFPQLMLDAPNGYRAHYLFAHHVGMKSRLSQMDLEYRRALKTFPYDAGMTLTMAHAYARAGLCEPAAAIFDWTFQVDSTIGQGRYAYTYCLARLGKWSDAKAQALKGLQLGPAEDSKRLRNALRRANAELAREKHS